MSPRELHRELQAAGLRLQDESDRDLALAWHGELFSRQKKLESLPTLLKRTRVSKGGEKKSAGQMLASMQILAAQYKIPLRHRKES